MINKKDKRLIGAFLLIIFLIVLFYSFYAVLQNEPPPDEKKIDSEFVKWSSQYLQKDARYGFVDIFGPILDESDYQDCELWIIFTYSENQNQDLQLDQIFIIDNNFNIVADENKIDQVLISYILCEITDLFDNQGNITDEIKSHVDFLKQIFNTISNEKENIQDERVFEHLEQLQINLKQIIEFYHEISNVNIKNIHGYMSIEEKFKIIGKNYEKSYENLVEIKNENIFSDEFSNDLQVLEDIINFQGNEIRKLINLIQSEKNILLKSIQKEVEIDFGTSMHVSKIQSEVKYSLSNITLEVQQSDLTHVKMDINISNLGDNTISEGHIYVPYSRTMIDSGSYVKHVIVDGE